MRFFTKLSNALFARPSSNHALCDTDFAKFFTAKIDEYQPELVLPNAAFNRFSFILKNGQNLILHVNEKSEIQSYLDSLAAETAPKETIAQLGSFKYMLCHEGDMLPDGKQWPTYSRPALPFDGKYAQYYYHIAETCAVRSLRE